MRTAWDNAGDRRPAVRGELAAIAVSAVEPEFVRSAAFELLLEDTSPEGVEATWALVGRWIGVEQSDLIATQLSRAIAERNWPEWIPQLARAASAWTQRERPEDDLSNPPLEAIRSLAGDTPLGDALLSVATGPDVISDRPELRLPERTRAAAWSLLVAEVGAEAMPAWIGERLDTLGESPAAATLRWSQQSLGITPLVGPEIDRLTELRLQRDRREASWLDAAVPVAQSIAGARAAHLRTFAWIADSRPELLSLDRADLIERLEAAQQDRQIKERDVRVSGGLRKQRARIADWSQSMSDADLLVTVAIDSMLDDSGLRARFAQVAELDRKDRETEYGGGLFVARDGSVIAELYRPRGSERGDDLRYVSPPDLIERLPEAIAHYHLHMNRVYGQPVAGPGAEDLRLIEQLGVVGIVGTSINGDRLNIDVYFPSGAVIDLGMIGLGSAVDEGRR